MKYQAFNLCRCEASPLPAASGYPSRRGSALLLVVVLVVLLALMGSTFLFVMRAARTQAVGPGSGSLMQGTWPTVPQADLDTEIEALRARVQTSLTNAVRPGGAYLLPGNLESQYTHPATAVTHYLSNRFPITEADRTGTVNVADSGNILWRFLSENPNHTGDQRTDFYVSQLRVTYPAPGSWPVDGAGNTYPGWVQQALSGRTRIFPAITQTAGDAKFTAAPVPSWRLCATPTPWTPYDTRFLAADSDGDGIPDCRLYKQGSHGLYDFWVGMRVVDNNAAVNLNTAWRSSADYDFTNTGIPSTDALTAYLGAFRANVGLYEMLVGSTADQTDVASTADADAELAALDAFRFSSAYNGLKDIYSGNDAATAGTQVSGYEHLSIADSLEQGLARRLGDPSLPNTKTGFYSAANRFEKFESPTQDQIASRFGLVNPDFSGTTLNARLPRTSLLYAPNTRNGAVVPQFLYYGANQSDYWYHTMVSTDSANSSTRYAFLTNSGNVNYPGSFTLNNIFKTIRPHLTAENGVTDSAPYIAAPGGGLVATSTLAADWSGVNAKMADYGAVSTDEGTPRKVWANGATFGELWRGYYNVFKATPATPNPAQTTRYNNGGNAAGAGLPTWSPDKQLLLRAAIAAVNTMQARLPATDPAIKQQITIGGTSINIFGAKRQPFITEVMFETGRKDPTVVWDAASNPIEVKWVAIELHNPYNVDISLAQQELYIVTGGVTWTLGADLATATTVPATPAGVIPAGGFKTIVAKRSGYTDTGSPVNAMADVGAPANNAIINAFPVNPGAGDSIRLVASDANTGKTTNGYDMIPQDEIDLSSATTTPGTPQRFRCARPTLTTTNSRFNCVYSTVTPTFTHIEDNGTPPAVSWSATLNGTLGADNAVTGGNSKEELVIQVAGYAPYKPGSITNQLFPFNGFARDGDLLHVAFIGNYSYTTSPTSPYVCSVGRDAYYAEDGDAANDAYEAVGRFAPLAALNMTPNAGDNYGWAGRLFDFVTAIQHPGSEYTPDIATAAEKLTYAGRSIQGKVNINTASWQALAALPLVPGSASDTVKLAKAIVYFRDINDGTGSPHGPFTSVFELNLVKTNGSVAALNIDFAGKAAGLATNAALSTTDLTSAGVSGVGDFSPTDNAIGDFEQRLMGITRLSNLVTTRSDSFTVYIVAQAWLRDAAPDSLNGGAPVPPIMVGEKRTAFIMDRTTLTRDTTNNLDWRALKDRP